MNKEIMIGNHKISEDSPTFVIAEMSANHLMDFDRAVAIMQAAKDANPLIGANMDELGLRFPDMSHVYDKDLQQIIRETAKENGIYLQEGIYTQLTGPSFESPAEIRMLRTLGCDAVGMSTVVEAIAANHMGMQICGISCISNLAAGMTDQPLNHEEVQEAADMAAPRFKKLVTESVKKFV